MSVDEEEERFPSWDEPATKGDILLSMIYVRGLTLSLYRMIGAFNPVDQDRLRVGLAEYDEAWKLSEQAIDVISGKKEAMGDE